MRRLLLTLAVVAAVAAIPAGGLAAGGGTLTATPNPVTQNATFTLSGCGYTVPTSISFEVTGPKKATPSIHYFTGAEPLGTDSGGCFSQEWTAWWGVTGTFQITSWTRDSHGSTRKGAVLALTVTP
jgi:hypothetical protein